jgi:hypothetical protein
MAPDRLGIYGKVCLLCVCFGFCLFVLMGETGACSNVHGSRG